MTYLEAVVWRLAGEHSEVRSPDVAQRNPGAFSPATNQCRNVIVRSGATKNLFFGFVVSEQRANLTRVPKKSRSFARAQDDAGAVLQIATQSGPRGERGGGRLSRKERKAANKIGRPAQVEN